MTLEDKIKLINDWNDWSAQVVERNGDTISCEFQKYSPAGQDFSFNIWTDDDGSSLAHDIFEYYENFDVSLEAYLWLDCTGHGMNGAPYDMKDVYEDMEACKDMVEGLWEYAEKMKEHTYDIVECCPYCENENVYEMPNDSKYIKSRFMAVCKCCGKTIFLCNECQHCEDNPNGDCDWTEVARNCGCCKRGMINNKTGEEVPYNDECK